MNMPPPNGSCACAVALASRSRGPNTRSATGPFKAPPRECAGACGRVSSAASVRSRREGRRASPGLRETAWVRVLDEAGLAFRPALMLGGPGWVKLTMTFGAAPHRGPGPPRPSAVHCCLGPQVLSGWLRTDRRRGPARLGAHACGVGSFSVPGVQRAETEFGRSTRAGRLVLEKSAHARCGCGLRHRPRRACRG